MDEEIQRINEARVRLEERDKNQEDDIKENKRLIEQLFDHKNNAQRDLTVLKTKGGFLPYLIMILSALVAAGTVVWQIVKAMSIG
jgi:hypothetical protein